MKLCAFFLIWIGLLPLAFAQADSLKDKKYRALIAKLEWDVRQLAKVVETLYHADRCNTAVLQDCGNSNYDDCHSLYPSQTCQTGENFYIPKCGKPGSRCGSFWDFSISSASFAFEPGANPTDPLVIETICFTKRLDEWFLQKYQNETSYWHDFNVEPPQGMYFGSRTGAFRIYPARQSDDCQAFDPRERPWYVAASSGPKNVIMILDTSGSMARSGSLGLMKDAAYKVVNTLAVGDSVALITYNDDASTVAASGGTLLAATEANKANLKNVINYLDAGGRTNVRAAFDNAFRIFRNSIQEEIFTQCNTAILYLTDGSTNNSTGQQELIKFIVNGIQEIQNATKHPVLLFTYSVKGDYDVDTLPKDLACATDFGVWTSIEKSEDIPTSLSSYYTLFSLGLGSAKNENFTAWVEPYEYKDGGVIGTTVSSPVYDKTKKPFLFLGVVGIDLTISALNAVLNSTDYNNTLNVTVMQSTAFCPSLNLDSCDLESYRQQGGNRNALCNSSCSEPYVNTFIEQCSGMEDFYPRNLWMNTDNSDKTYEQRVCCQEGSSTASEHCSATLDKKHGAAIWASVAGGLILLCMVFVAIMCCRKEHNQVYPPTQPSAEHVLELPPPDQPTALHIIEPPTTKQSELQSDVNSLQKEHAPCCS